MCSEFFQLDDPVLEQVREQILDLDIDNLTPVEALMKLNEIKKVVSGSAAANQNVPNNRSRSLWANPDSSARPAWVTLPWNM